MSDHSTVKAVIIPEVIKFISDKYKISLESAMDNFYSSKTCEALSDDATNLYSQSAWFIFSLYESEMKSGEDCNKEGIKYE